VSELFVSFTGRNLQLIKIHTKICRCTCGSQDHETKQHPVNVISVEHTCN